MSLSYYWVFTINNPSDDFEPQVVVEDFKYMVFQYEMGERQTVHIQGYVVFGSRKRLSAVRSSFAPLNPHLEVRRGSHSEAKGYCSKADTRVAGPYEFGDDSGIPEGGRGSRSDLKGVMDMIKGGVCDREIAEKYPGDWLRYFKGIQASRGLFPEVRLKRSWKTQVYVFIGDPGAGKSSLVSYMAPNAYEKSASNKWFDGYEGHEDVLFDDFNGQWFPWSTLMQVLDRYECYIEVKGSLKPFLAKRVFITSNYAHNKWYDGKYPIHALERRIDFLWYFSMVSVTDSKTGAVLVPDPRSVLSFLPQYIPPPVSPRQSMVE